MKLCTWRRWGLDYSRPKSTRRSPKLRSGSSQCLAHRCRLNVVIGHEKAPFDIILPGAPVVSVPRELLDQIGIGRRPVTRGDEKRELVLFERSAAQVRSRRLCRVRFMPLRPLT